MNKYVGDQGNEEIQEQKAWGQLVESNSPGPIKHHKKYNLTINGHGAQQGDVGT